MSMRNQFWRLLMTTVGVGLGGCAAPPVAVAPTPKDVFVRLPADRLWSSLLVSLTDLSLPIENMDKASWFMRTQELRLSKQDAASGFDCGAVLGVPRTKSVDVFARVTILLRPAGDSTGVRIQVTPRGFDQGNASLKAQGNPFAGDPNVACVSLGAIEKNILARVTATP
jgi:hypothetical protein